ncbi:hypothetical protein SAMN05660865_00392 [Caloramator fervidus]|uniref:Uncharacterized protein n=1 Tax=Caloramator fervidus TaxID=29344 RepID=A0A1H5SKS3_9CLOT|nr:hypothetical protein [Caloramator fervidus]SEF51105.1 hypothetical protein SAMN05660865_00392 [Caloramator fervidus]
MKKCMIAWIPYDLLLDLDEELIKFRNKNEENFHDEYDEIDKEYIEEELNKK